MIRKRDEQPSIDVRPIGGGIGKAEIRHKFTREEMFGKCRLCAEITLQPGQTIGEHAHDGEFEIFYMLRGELVSGGCDGAADEPFLPGDMMLTGGGARHALRNEGSEPATILAVIVL